MSYAEEALEKLAAKGGIAKKLHEGYEAAKKGLGKGKESVAKAGHKGYEALKSHKAPVIAGAAGLAAGIGAHAALSKKADGLDEMAERHAEHPATKALQAARAKEEGKFGHKLGVLGGHAKEKGMEALKFLGKHKAAAGVAGGALALGAAGGYSMKKAAADEMALRLGYELVKSASAGDTVAKTALEKALATSSK